MMQEYGGIGRILPVRILDAIRGMNRLARRKTRIRGYRVLAALLGLFAVTLLVKFPGKAVSLERQQEQLEMAASLYYDAQSKNNQLRTELSEINTADFIERTARREYGYCWYGETIYEVGNLDEFEQEPEFEAVSYTHLTLDEARIDINVPFEYWKRKITEEEAKESARHLLMGKYGYGEDVMEGFRYEAQEQEGIIVVRAYPFEEMEDEYFTLKYHYDGRLSSDEIPDILDFSAYTKEVQETGVPIQFYTHEQRAAYSQIYIPKVEAAGRLNPRSAEVKYHSLFTNHVYGVPTPEDMPEEEAMEIARNALVKEFGCTWDWLRVGSGYFDITDPDAPLWKLLAVHSDEKEVWDRYIVRVNARTGEVVAAFEVTGDTPLEEMY